MRETKQWSNRPGLMTKMAAMLTYGNKTFKICPGTQRDNDTGLWYVDSNVGKVDMLTLQLRPLM